MATVFSHGIAAASLATAFRPPRSTRFWFYGIVCSMVPDVDVIGFRFGIRYGDLLGHRGLTHSILFAVILSAAATAAISAFEPATKRGRLWSYLFLATISHGILDAFTDGGLGVALFSPFVTTRYFFPIQPIEVSPIGGGFFSVRGLEVIESEVLWIWPPSAVFAGLMCLLHHGALRKAQRA